MKLSTFLSDIGRPVAFYPGLVKALGDRNESIFICQMAYWREKGENQDGWIYKDREEIESETSLTYKEQMNVRAGLKKKKLMVEKYVRSEHKMYYKIDWQGVNSIWEQFTNGQVPVDQRESGSLPTVISLNSNTENTTEILKDVEAVARRTSVFATLFQDNITMITPMLADSIQDIVVEFPDESWYAPAFKIAVEGNHRDLRYIRAVLKNWKEHHFGWSPQFKKNGNGKNGTTPKTLQKPSDEDSEWEKKYKAQRANAGHAA